ncbi:MAG: imidazole glycerol phosphate synthase subunit HisH [Opitutaceae bacterium]|nr:imidazole glycerol phosphate synthase subunit HisH [Cytophagales bacterium]
MKVAIIKYNAGNTQSVIYALNRLGCEPIVSDDKEIILSADKVIFPGVGEASTAMEYLKERNLDKLITELKQPVLGICLGLQLMCSHSEENNTKCLGIFDIKVKKFESDFLKVPQMGWNNVYDLKTTLFDNIKEKDYMYFVHSYYAELSDFTVAKTSYVNEFSSSLQKDNFYAVQFHTEKSATAGSQLLENFLKL